MFHVFRKNQRLLLAVFGVMLMIAFTLGSVPNFLGDHAGGQDPLLATSRYGDFRGSEVGLLIEQRNLVKQFLYQAMIQARLQDWVENMQKQFGGDLQSLLSPQMLQGIEGRIGNELAFELSQSIGPSTERSVVETSLQAKLAQREGIVVTDDAITEYLRLHTGDRVSGEQMKTILAQLPSRTRQRVSRSHLYEALRTELAAAKYRQFFLLGMQSTPAERWEYYSRLKRRATVELVSLSAADMLSQVAEPSERELLAFFDAHKQELAEPGSPKPGFRVPHKAAFEYLRADYESFYDEATVEDKDILEEYEKNKDEKYRYSSLAAESEEDDADVDEKPAEPAEEKATDKKIPDEAKADEKRPDDKNSDETKAGAPNSDEKKPDEKKADEKKADEKNADEKKADEKKADEKKVDKKAANKKPAKKQPVVKKPAAKKPAEDGDKSEGGSNDGGFADEQQPKVEAQSKVDVQPKVDEQPKDEAKPADEKPAAEKPAAEDKPSAEEKKPAEEKPPADEKPAAETLAAEAKKTADDKPADKSDASDTASPDLKPPANAPTDETPKTSFPPLMDRFELPDDIKAGKSPAYAPLWKVRDRIRKDLAAARAVAKMDAALEKVRPQLTRYSEQRANAEYQKQPAPPPPDFTALAKTANVTSGKLPLESAYEVSREPGLGQSTVGSDRFVDFAYGSVKPYTVVTAQDSEGNRYLFWKTADVAGHVPELAEVRSEVLRTWKMMKARDLVRRKADEIASTARSAAKPLKESLDSKGYKVVDAGPFSWLTTGSAGDFNGATEPEISSVDGVVDPGPDFMQSIFDLRVGDVGVTMNNPETNAYVVRLTTLEPSESVLRDTFLADKGGTPQQVAQASRFDQRKIVDAWREKFESDVRLVWEQPPSDDISNR